MAEKEANKAEKKAKNTEAKDSKVSDTSDKKEAAKKTVKKSKKAKRRHVPIAIANVFASFNNTIVTLADPDGNVIAWSSAGANGFKGTRKSTPYAAQIAAENAGDKAKVFGVEKIHVYVKGVGNGREQAIRGLVSKGFDLLSINDITPIPHNGCRKPKTRRV